jgi:uncharacterized membrane protein
MTWLLAIPLVVLWLRVSSQKDDYQRMRASLVALRRQIDALKIRLDKVESEENAKARPGEGQAAPMSIPTPAMEKPLASGRTAAPAEIPVSARTCDNPEYLDLLSSPARLDQAFSEPDTHPSMAHPPETPAQGKPLAMEAPSPQAASPAPAGDIADPQPAAKPESRPITPARRPRPDKPASPASPGFAQRAFMAAKDWLFGGNTVLRTGVLLLFIGFAFLLRYAAERVTLPVEFRYIGVAGAALALLTLGWRLRLKNALYGLTLQGTGIAVLYLTSFAAMRLHGLLPPPMVFALLVLFAAAATALAVLQDAVVLASAAALGGFATPILVSSGGGDHVMLFGYFALLNAGILLVAWFKAWRILNLIGFFGTFGIGFAWGIQNYEAAKFATTEPFLVLFFLMYVSIGLLFARRRLLEAEQAPEGAGRRALLRWSVGRTDYIDGTLVFGPPLVGFGQQYALVEAFHLGTAFSALALGLFYFVLALCLRGRRRIGLLTEICLALGVIFVTLAPPLAFDSRGVISAIWALEGTGIYWLSLVQRRGLARAFSLALIAASALAYLMDTEIGRASLLHNSPLGAALIGLALLFCHRALRRAPEEAITKADRACRPLLAIAGLVFLYFVAPLCFGYESTIIAWALAGAVTMFAGIRVESLAFKLCALGIQILAGLLLLLDLRLAVETLLRAPPLAAGVLGAALLVDHCLLRHASEENTDAADRKILPILAVAGLSFLYLIAPLCFDWEYTVIAWALFGLATVLAAYYLDSRAFLGASFVIQALGALLFVGHLETGGTGLLDSGWTGLACSSLIGLALITSVVIARTSEMARRNKTLMRRLDLGLLAGLVFINLALAFVLGWDAIGTGWAVSGLMLLCLGLWLRQELVLYFGAVLEAVAGASLLYALAARLAPSGTWAPVVLALAALAGAWRMRHAETQAANVRQGKTVAPESVWNTSLSTLLLVWGMIWWVWAAVDQVFAFAAGPGDGDFAALLRHGRGYGVLSVLALSSGVWTAIARRANWRALALFACGLPLVTAAGLLATCGPGPFALGAPAWTACFISHFLALKRLDELYSDSVRRCAHIAGVWLFVGLLAQAGHDTLANHVAGSGLESAWPWLGCALAPSAYLWLAGSEGGKFWPLSDFAREYRYQAALPILLSMLVWLWTANACSAGDAAPLPYLPLANPLELGLLLALLACWRWSRAHLLSTGLAPESAKLGALAVGASFLAFITMAVCRVAHAWAGVPFRFDAMTASMGVQATWSLVWSLSALALMIGGNHLRRRPVWMIGAALMAVVVVKLFFVELGDQGGLARIVSFIGVGLLLLVVGYFSPLPPKTAAAQAEDA